jgi:hypothetical protein
MFESHKKEVNYPLRKMKNKVIDETGDRNNFGAFHFE